MRYYIAKFWYPGPYNGNPDATLESRLASKHLLDAHDEITEILNRAKIDWRTEYEWPDGSLYLYIESEFDIDQTKMVLERVTGRDVSLTPGKKSGFDRRHKQ